MFATYEGHDCVVNVLMDNGAHVNLQNEVSQTFLHASLLYLGAIN